MAHSHAAEVAEIRLQQRLQKMGSDYLVEQVEGLLDGRSSANAATSAVAASVPKTTEDLVARSILFARQAGFLHDEVRLQQFVGLLAGVAQHATARPAAAVAQPGVDATHAEEASDSDDDESSDGDDDADEDSVHEVAKDTPRRGPVGSPSWRHQLNVDTARGPIVPSPDTPRSRRPEGASPTSLSPSRMRPSEAPQSLLTLFAAFIRDMPVRCLRKQKTCLPPHASCCRRRRCLLLLIAAVCSSGGRSGGVGVVIVVVLCSTDYRPAAYSQNPH
jgi:hypothetical protein